MTTHEFQPDPEYPAECKECQLPQANKRHAVVAAAVPALPSATRNYTHVSPHATDKSNEAGLRAFPKSGGIKARLLDTIVAVDSGRGMTDNELQTELSSIGVNSLRPRRVDLVADGWLEPVYDAHGHAVTRGGFTAWRLTAAGRLQWRDAA